MALLQWLFRHLGQNKVEPKTFVVTADDFSFQNGGYLIRGALSGALAARSLSMAQSEELDLQLVWAHHPDREIVGNYPARVTAVLKEAWLWHQCAQVMHPNSFYRGKALSVSDGYILEAGRMIRAGGAPAVKIVEAFIATNQESALGRRAKYALTVAQEMSRADTYRSRKAA